MNVFTQEQLKHVEKFTEEVIKHKEKFPDASAKECFQVGFDLYFN